MAGRKKINREDLEKKLEPVEEKMEIAAQTVEGIAKETAGKAVRTRKKAVSALEQTRKKASEAGKEAASVFVPEVYVQWEGNEFSCAQLLERAKEDFRAHDGGAIFSCKIYIKPEDGMVYYVISGKEGKFSL